MPVTRLEITHRSPFELGKRFGEIGTYTYLEGKVHFEIDPANESNVRITDIDLAPVNSSAFSKSNSYGLSSPLFKLSNNSKYSSSPIFA